jgi:signal transduction histidine kinase
MLRPPLPSHLSTQPSLARTCARALRDPRAVAFACAVVLQLGVATVRHRSVDDAISRTGWVAHSHEVIAAVDRATVALCEVALARVGAREGGHAAAELPLAAALDRAGQLLAAAERLGADDPEQHAALAAIREEWARLTRESPDPATRAGEAGERPGDPLAIHSLERAMAEVREREEKLLMRRIDRADASSRALTVVQWAGTAISVSLLGLVFFLLTREIRERRATQIALEREIEQRRAAESALRTANEAAELANAELESFSYAVSHDLRAPLRAIDGFGQALVEDCEQRLDEAGRDYLGRIRAATQRMGCLIDDLLQLSRVMRTELRVDRVDLSAIARGIVRELRASDPARKVVVDVAPELVATGDEPLLRVALDNLLRNAWKFTSRRPVAHIEVGAVAGATTPTFFVRDDGAGFDPAYADKLFAPFQRLHSNSEFPGTGVGLATVQRVLARHRGKVRAEGAVGFGATFTFELPDREGGYRA